MLTLPVLLGAVYRTINNPRLGTDMFLLAVWERVVDTTMIRTANEKQDVNTTMVRTSNKKRVVVGTKSGTDQDYHRRILKTHSRSEYNSTSEELVDKTQEGLAIVITERNEKSIVYVSPIIRIPPRVRRACLIVTLSNTYNRQSRLMWN